MIWKGLMEFSDDYPIRIGIKDQDAFQAMIGIEKLKQNEVSGFAFDGDFHRVESIFKFIETQKNVFTKSRLK